jgi:serine O-acetyltransferase
MLHSVACEDVTADRVLVDRVWDTMSVEAEHVVAHEPKLAILLTRFVIARSSFEDGLAHVLAAKIANPDVGESELAALIASVLIGDPAIAESAAVDLTASVERNPAYPDLVTPFVFAKGFHALQWHRVAHALWRAGRRAMAAFVQSRVSEVLAVDIHPAATIGRGVFIDHATGIVIGETAVVDDDVSILQDVTLGGTGKERGDRHPKIGRGVLLAAGAKVLGNVTVGTGAKVAAGSVVLRAVPPHTTVAGIPARVVRHLRDESPSHSMDQDFVADFQI